MATIYEGVSVKLMPAPFGKRVLAYIIDAGIVTSLLYLLFFVLLFLALGTAGVAAALKKAVPNNDAALLAWLPIVLLIVVGLLAAFLIFDGYFIYFEFKKGQTPGKRMFGLKVVSLKNQRLTFGQCVLREVFRHVDCLLVIPGLLSVTMSKRQQRLGDMAASTLVVYSKASENKQVFVYVGQEDYHWLTDALAPSPVNTDTCREFLAFAYPNYILKSTTAPDAVKQHWENVARKHLTKADAVKLDRDSVLRFFAEICFQTLNKEQT